MPGTVRIPAIYCPNKYNYLRFQTSLFTDSPAKYRMWETMAWQNVTIAKGAADQTPELLGESVEVHRHIERS